MRWLLFLCAFMLVGSLTAEEDQKVKMRGFLFRDREGVWVLSSEPNLKSCCIGSKDKASQQIILEGSFEENLINRAVEVEGVFKERHLYEAKLVQSKHEINYVKYGLAGLGIAVAGLCMIAKYRNKNSPQRPRDTENTKKETH